LLDLLPISKTDNFNLIFSSKCEFVERIIDSHSLEGSIEDPLAFYFILHLLLMGGNMAIVSL
jgi:hypothetical protein